jgi:hypothetical protein
VIGNRRESNIVAVRELIAHLILEVSAFYQLSEKYGGD